MQTYSEDRLTRDVDTQIDNGEPTMLIKQVAKKSQLVISCILLIAILVRVWGIRFGLPDLFHTDEGFEVYRALKLGAGVFDYDRVTKGGYFYLLFIEYGIYFIIMKTLGVLSSSNEFIYSIIDDPSTIWTIGRVTTAIIGSANCLLMYFIGKNMYSRAAGLLAALFLSVNLLHVESSHYITVDVPLTFLISLMWLVIYYIPKNGLFTIKHYSLLGVFTALSVMTKITGVVMVFPILAFHYNNIKSEEKSFGLKSFLLDKRMIYFSCFFILIYIVGNPGIIFKIKWIVSWAVSFIVPVEISGIIGPKYPIFYSDKSVFRTYLDFLFTSSHLLVNAMIVGGIIFSLKILRNRNYPLFFIIPYFVFLCSSKSIEHVYARYLLPIIPILCIYAGLFCCEAYNLISKKISCRYATGFISVLVCFGLFTGLREVVALDIRFSNPDTRTIAKEWVLKNIPGGSSIFIEGSMYKSSPMTVPLLMDPDFISMSINEESKDSYIIEKGNYYNILRDVYNKKKTFNLIFASDENRLSETIKNGGEYLILLDESKKKFDLEQNRKDFPHFYQLIKQVDSGKFKLIKKFKSNKFTSGPEILIYKRESLLQAYETEYEDFVRNADSF